MIRESSEAEKNLRLSYRAVSEGFPAEAQVTLSSHSGRAAPGRNDDFPVAV